ncbi:MAG TPA: hypothetical protein VLG50_04685 [Candidatus Saccharimonadales bacterium]|nr:hypothetical protein [Candidatus Saccharimonadales bacterium]
MFKKFLIYSLLINSYTMLLAPNEEPDRTESNKDKNTLPISDLKKPEIPKKETIAAGPTQNCDPNSKSAQHDLDVLKEQEAQVAAELHQKRLRIFWHSWW